MEQRRREELGEEWKAIRRGWCFGEDAFRDELAKRPKGDPVKVAVAAHLRRETTMTLKWISERLRIGACTHSNKRLYEERKANTQYEYLLQRSALNFQTGSLR
jgi:hypothetical protein